VILRYSGEAKERIRKLYPELKKSTKQALEELSNNPYLGKKLKRELEGMWSLRVKKWRIIYQPYIDTQEIWILSLGPRKTIYQEMSERT
jgi:mRNA interferase RelE/StbE